MSVMSQTYSIIIDRGISAPGNGKEVVDGLNDVGHAVFHYFLSDDSKQDAATNTSHSKRLISFLKNKQVLTTALSTIW